MNASDTPEHIVGYGNFGNDELVFEEPFVALYEKIWELISNAIDQGSIDRDEDFSDPDNSLGMDLSSRGWVEMLLESGVEVDIREFDAEGPGLSDTFFDIIARDDQERNNLKDSLTGLHDEISERIRTLACSGNWVVDILHHCHLNNHCTKINCTTCGATEFRHMYLAAAASDLGIECWKRPNIGNWNRSDRKKILVRLSEELKNISPEHVEQLKFDGINLLIQDLYYTCPKNELDLSTLLGDSPSGKVLESMVAHHNSRIAEARQDAEYEAANRRANEFARQLHQQRMHQSIPGPSVPDSPKDIWVKSIQKKLRDMTPDQILSLIIEEEPDFPLGAVPMDYIPTDADVSRLSDEKRKELRDRIGNRKNGWQRIAKELSDD